MNSQEELKIIETVLDYYKNGGTDLEPNVMSVSTEHYVDPNVLDREITTLFRNFPIIVGHSSQLAEAGQFITHDSTGVPILVARNRDGAINAFLNVCRHRGARVAGEACGKAATFSCPYHGWTYDLQGQLRGIPKATGFGQLEKSDFGLIGLPAFERYGMIWVVPSTNSAKIDIDAWLAPMAEQFASLNLEDHVIFESWSVDCEMNWHIALEGFQENYHFCTAHKDTACASYLDTQSVWVDHYPHIRHAVPLSNIEKLNNQPQEEWSYRKHFMTQNYMFPCNYLQVMTDHVYIHTVTPRGMNQCTFQCIMLIPEAPASEKAEKYWRANYNVVREVFNEDFTIGEGIQAGLASGANEFFTIGRFENGIQLARKAMDDALAGRLEA